eukprot:CAMPEP_0206230410 /NCGR_PEP_ID=MMETSP0047_2-20121206/10247_1 /ASSEMBLY_ACC=CAM_ASM_000192 /TAXON_ID=195065 /ORGANISM="Chroomonas mesostigmatica_cf, Strain CCMP1168" /LENGTH=374 /DNA_ID=CAMNT_0053653837 /DNA_START=32 /DNA_END=1156 /DNA_ORIENTATION=+
MGKLDQSPRSREAKSTDGSRVGAEKKRSFLSTRVPLWPVLVSIGAAVVLNLCESPSFTPLRMRESLAGKVAVVTGASRGIGRGIALGLGEKGATVYVTGRSEDAIRATADEVTARGGRGVPVVCDHSNDEAIKGLFEKIEKEEGKLNILVNNCFSAVRDLAGSLGAGIDHKGKFWERGLDWWDKINAVGLRAHFIASQHAVPLMLRNASAEEPGLLVTVSSMGGSFYIFDAAYGVGKAAKDRMAHDMAVELKDQNIASISLWPGAVKTEIIEEEIIKKGAKNAAGFEMGESTEYSGRAVASLALDQDVMKMTGRTLWTADLGDKYSFADHDKRLIHNFRSLKTLVGMASPSVAQYIPSFIKIPLWVFALASNKF